jgi:lipoate-protein ligase A
MTLVDLKQYIAKNVNEVDLLELLDISSEELVEAFSDTIEENFDKLIYELELTDETDEFE